MSFDQIFDMVALNLGYLLLWGVLIAGPFWVGWKLLRRRTNKGKQK
jgi:hypothetical protein